MSQYLERVVHVPAAPAEVFARLDDQTRAIEEVTVERQPARRKAWRTAGDTHLLVIDGYRMGFDVAAEAAGTRLKVWIDYALPHHGLLGRVAAPLGALYARWRVDDLAQDAADSFTDMSAVVIAHP
jgi:hypothetical protein